MEDRRAVTDSDSLAQGHLAENQTLAERLAGEIADAILNEFFAPGFRLDEHLLAQRFGVSRTPVREALRQLAATGLIDMRPRRGAIVARVTQAELEALFVAMGEMEATCARLSAMSMTPVERRRLAALHDRMAELVRAGDPEPYALANQGFHESIYAGAHNAVLSGFTAGLRRRLAPFRRAQFRTPGRLPRSHAEHDAVVKAILAGDSTTAHAAMLHHVSLVEDAYDALSASSAA
jgi:DNA-binding GntR family transcriptional regulator